MSCRDKELIRISYIVLRYVDDLRIDKEFINTSYYCIEKRLGAVQIKAYLENVILSWDTFMS